MNRTHILLITFFIPNGLLFSQTIETSKLNHSIYFGIARSKFKVSGILTEEYSTLDFQTGYIISKRLSQRFKIKSGIGFYFKGKRKSYFVNNTYSGNKTPLPILDEATSKRYHAAFDFPLRVEYSFFNFKSSFNSGLMVRFWQPTNLVGDVLRSQHEFGYLMGASYRISSRFKVGVDFYFGLSRLAKLPILSGYYTVKQNYMQAQFEYSF